MHWQRLFVLLGVSATALLSPVAADPIDAVPPSTEPARLLQVRSVLGGQAIKIYGAGIPRGGEPVPFDNLSLPGSASGLNIAYSTVAAYTNPNGNPSAVTVPLADRLAYAAPSAPGAFPPIPFPTDLVWDDYRVDPGQWPGGAGAVNALTTFSCVPFLANNQGTPEHPIPAARPDTLVVLFFSTDGTQFIGGFDVDYETPPGFFGYFRADFDLRELNPPLLVPAEGRILYHWIRTPGGESHGETFGVGMMFAGGDLQNHAFPTPQSLVTTGTADANEWSFADGVTGAMGPPDVVDPDFDGNSGVSPLDVLNTGFLLDWQFTAGGNPPTNLLAHDFPKRMVINQTIPTGRCEVVGLCLQTTAAECREQGGEYRGDGTACPTGACRLVSPQPACVDLIEFDCIVQGGAYLGDGTTCERGACLVGGVPGLCGEMSEAACVEQGGVFQGTGTNCAAGACFMAAPQPFCFILASFDCSVEGGAYRGDGTTCEYGACVVGELCAQMTMAQCIEEGGVYQGEGTACTTGACRVASPQPGCIVTSSLDCSVRGGLFRGAGSTCETGACSVSGMCALMTEAQCLEEGGVFHGGGMECPTGACAFPGPAPRCVEATSLDCSVRAGVYRGDGTACALCPCDTSADGVLDSQDFFNFIGEFFSAGPVADFNADGRVDSQDFFGFLACLFDPPPGC